jgi:DNA-directed RNA polymerase specialized sigma24 family protein
MVNINEEYQNERLKELLPTFFGIAAKLSDCVATQEDLVQEMLLEYVSLKASHPNQTESWYILGCKHEARNASRKGVSVDNGAPYHRRDIRFEWLDETGENSETLIQIAAKNCNPAQSASVLDIVDRLSERLTPRQNELLALLLGEHGPRSAALILGTSHANTVKLRQKINQEVVAVVNGDKSIDPDLIGRNGKQPNDFPPQSRKACMGKC